VRVPRDRSAGFAHALVVGVVSIVLGLAAAAVAAIPRFAPEVARPMAAANARLIADRVDDATVDITATRADTGATVAGTGMVLTPDGSVLTNFHVVEGADRIVARIGGVGHEFRAHLVGAAPEDDVALLDLEGAVDLATIVVADPHDVALGDPVVVVGNAFGRAGALAVSGGKVTSLRRDISAGDPHDPDQSETLRDMIEVDARVEPGDSGGPLLDAQARVIGMNTATAVSSGTGGRAAPAGFAIPIDRATALAARLARAG
jgi:S1-C subfamily serine protease